MSATEVSTATAEPRAQAAFEQAYGAEPTLRVRSPGRVNLIGEHTDYNDGWCLPCAIDRHTVLLARPRADGQVNVLACDQAGTIDRFDASQPLQPQAALPWANYVRGTLAAMQQRGVQLAGADVAISSDLPLGAGLSSSASLEMAVAKAFGLLAGQPAPAWQMALDGQWAEHHYAGCQCGIMDQLACAGGQAEHALLLDCRSLQVQAVPMPAHMAVLVIDSRMARGLVDSEYNLRREQCTQAAAMLGVAALRDISLADFNAKADALPALLRRRARHVVGENQRVLDAVQALAAGDLARTGELLRASHRSLRDDFEVVPPVFDTMITLANDVLGTQGGARITGGGFGGCAVALAPRAAMPELMQALATRWRSPDGQAPRLWLCQASAGVEAFA